METGLLHCFIILLLSAAVDPCANPASETRTLRGAHSPVQRGATLRDLRLLRQAGQGPCEREGLRDTDIVVLVQQKNLIVSYSGWHQIWMMEFSSVELCLWDRKALGASFTDFMSISASLLKDQRESFWGSLSFLPSLLQDEAESVNTAEFFQVTTTVCWPNAFRPKWLPLESQLPAVHGLMFSRHTVMSLGAPWPWWWASEETEKGGVGPMCEGGVPAQSWSMACSCGVRSLHALHWCGQVR